MKVFVTGGTGFVGTYLTKKLAEKGHRLTLLTRRIRKDRPLPSGAEYLEGDPTRTGPWQDRVSEHEVVINLAGTSLFRRWTKSAKKSIYDSRILTTQNLVDALAAGQPRNTAFLSTSAVGYYGFHEDEDLDEESPPGEVRVDTDIWYLPETFLNPFYFIFQCVQCIHGRPLKRGKRFGDEGADTYRNFPNSFPCSARF